MRYVPLCALLSLDILMSGGSVPYNGRNFNNMVHVDVSAGKT